MKLLTASMRGLAALDIDTALFNHAAADIGRRVRQEKERKAQMGFDDLLTRLHDALHRQGNGQLARVIREQFPAALIDEFQDTDPVQYAIFRKIYLDLPEKRTAEDGRRMTDDRRRMTEDRRPSKPRWCASRLLT